MKTSISTMRMLSKVIDLEPPCFYYQQNLLLPKASYPIMRATSKTASIRDRKHFKKDYWAIMPEKNKLLLCENSQKTTIPLPMAYRVLTQLAGMIGLDETIKPKPDVGHYQLSGFEYKTRDMGAKGLLLIVDNDLLKRGNLIVDNKSGDMYMQPNSLTNARYRKSNEYLMVIVTGLVLVLAEIVFYIKTRKNKGSRPWARNLRWTFQSTQKVSRKAVPDSALYKPTIFLINSLTIPSQSCDDIGLQGLRHVLF